ncbi:hypothetical protein EJ06DRAFT_555570 [Trichodelitschia bisporula]|uniref:LisH domain-containing protein n=1 Tax=Trichodelitschia bisporula TaxID=703511 RepID=A0A6G1I0Y3_9PEZI|nr:hypothetical protein EJ06DRAFT_555570 [Trichodelitschia bisporula]
MNAPGANMVMNSVGGPVGGPMPINQANQGASRSSSDQEIQRRLNTYIYDYMCRNHHYELARQFLQCCPILEKKHEANGVDDSMDTDSKDEVKRPTDLPFPDIPSYSVENCFLLDWWNQFWDIFATRQQGNMNSLSGIYLTHNIVSSKQRAIQHQGMLRPNGDPNMMRPQYAMMPQGSNINMAKAALANNRSTPQQLQLQAKLMQNQAREGGNMDMGQRPQSPAGNMENGASSPSKRPRLDNTNGFNGPQMGPSGRGQPLQQPNMQGGGGPNNMMLQNGLTPDLASQQMNAFGGGPNMQQKFEMGASPAGSMPDGLDMMPNRGIPAGGAPPSQGNHALQDYQMQLMLLEQQNKKRLLMARQEQDNHNHVPVASGPGQGGGGGMGFAPNMSPSGSRAGPSPNPNEQLKRVAGTPKIGQPGVPGSPMNDIQNRQSPAPGFDPNQQMGPNAIQTQYFQQQMSNGMMGRAPSSHPPNFMSMPMGLAPSRAIQNGAGAHWGGQPGPQQQMPQQGNPGQQPQQMGNPQQRNTMPPPPAPQPEPPQPQRAQPSSPAPTQAPPTPSQSAKAAPKGKKETNPKKKAAPKNAKSANAAAAAENAEAAPPQAPSTPITPVHPTLGRPQQNGGPSQAANAPQQQPPVQPAPSVAPQMDANAAQFGALADNDNFSLDFAVGDTTDVFENLDFDTFLTNNEDNGFNDFNSLMNFGPDGVETGAGDV